MSNSLLSLIGQCKNPRSKIDRRVLIKRRLLTTGLYEDNWQDITSDVIKFGTIKKEIDSTRINNFKFSNITITLNNNSGFYNPSYDENSLWYGYGDQQRTLVKIVAGYVYESQNADGTWTRALIDSGGADYDVDVWDATGDFGADSTLFCGIVVGDVNITGNNQINLPVAPLQEAFRQFSAARLTGYNNSLTASDFMFMLRDQQDSSSNYIFRPFFGNTTTNWSITTTTVEYVNLSTATAQDLTNLTTWDVIQKLAEAENYIPHVTGNGKFKFQPRSTATTTAWEFYGGQEFSASYGTNIKKINFFGKRNTKYYSRVTVKFNDADTTTSYAITDSNYLVSGSSVPWTQGERTLQVQNNWIPNLATAETIADSLFNEFSNIKFEIEFTTPFIPHLELLDTVLITYDQTGIENNCLWDVYCWADTTGSTALDLEWDSSRGDALKLYQDEYKLISISINLDSLECSYVAREV